MTTYTAVGADLDLPITTAVDIQVKKSDKEINRQHNAATWENNIYAKINLEGTIKLTNRRAARPGSRLRATYSAMRRKPTMTARSSCRTCSKDNSLGPVGPYPYWWGWYSWPHWWSHFNGVAKVAWTLDLEPGKSVDLKYTWSYYWR